MILAHLQDSHVAGAARVNIYLTPLRQDGNEKTLSPIEFDRFETIKDAPKAKGKGGGYGKSRQR